MALFPKKGETNVTEPVSVIMFRDAEKLAIERAEAEAKCIANDLEIDGLALAAEQDDAEALAKIATLEDANAELHKAVRRKLHAERQLRATAENERKGENFARDQRLRKKLAKKSGTRLDPAKRIEKHIAGLLAEIRALQNTTDELHIAWSEAWNFRGPALSYPAKLQEMIAHELYAQAKAMNMKWPAAIYSQSDWPGLAQKIKTADAWVKSTLLDGETPIDETIEPELPTQSLQAALDPTTPLTDEEIAQNERHGNPRNLPLSGGAWEALKEKHATPIVRNINPFSGEEI